MQVGLCEASQFQVEVGRSVGPVEEEHVGWTARGRRGPEKGRERYRGSRENSGALAASYGLVSTPFAFPFFTDVAQHGPAYRRQAWFQVC